jgi:hypothetical protein
VQEESEHRTAAERLVHDLQTLLKEAEGRGTAAEAQLNLFKQ